MDLQNAVWSSEKVKSSLPQRSVDSHKGTHGTALLLAGTKDMPGAALLSGLGAMRSGVGKLELGTEAEVIPMVVSQLPETTYLRDGLSKAASFELDPAFYLMTNVNWQSHTCWTATFRSFLMPGHYQNALTGNGTPPSFLLPIQANSPELQGPILNK